MVCLPKIERLAGSGGNPTTLPAATRFLDRASSCSPVNPGELVVRRIVDTLNEAEANIDLATTIDEKIDAITNAVMQLINLGIRNIDFYRNN